MESGVWVSTRRWSTIKQRVQAKLKTFPHGEPVPTRFGRDILFRCPLCLVATLVLHLRWLDCTLSHHGNTAERLILL